MEDRRLHPRVWYTLIFAILLVVEVLIALFVRDRFIRPYGGDVLVTALICSFVRIFRTRGVPLLPLWVFLFAVVVEAAQAVDYVSLLGLSDSAFFRVLMGASFSVADILCYAAGCALFWLCERWLRKRKKSPVG